jgi:hypothetical protein
MIHSLPYCKMRAIAFPELCLQRLEKRRDLLEGYGAGMKRGDEGTPYATPTGHLEPKVVISAQSMRVLQ